MESGSPLSAAGDAAARLQGYAKMRARVEHRGPSRAFAVLLLWDAVALSLYLGVFLISFGGGPPTDAETGVGTYSYGLLVVPIMTLNLLVSGARERFSIRKKPSPIYWMAYALIIFAFLALLWASNEGVTYPLWLNLLMPVILFVTMAASPIRQLRRSGISDPERWTDEPLSWPVRWTTALIGVVMGLMAATSTQEWFPTVSAAGMLLLVVALFGLWAPWGLPRTGFEWGPIHWSAFGLVMGVLFALNVLLSVTGWVTTPISIVAGALALLIMVLAAVLPLPASGS